ncbi:Delta-9 acyl-phospholipid desaturase [Shewanella denitrificans OS217]|uniref:Delta-9 acyl-phospholipid desaturase n=1 Tax=Shewanella denitrificans (strain OS217 / ATCC BAA-1090 / DSM 15013) TaxID=318161 RepID=Q12SQ0_SHEDO|nr:fatty acid desaturase [Shewanella denitrificans]ABE53526.1 Delta-9 acyl-phospholipid desaturase [Shewanella denitrificans OS217]
MKNPPIIWLNTLLFALTLLGALVLVPWRGLAHGFDAIEWVAFVILAYASGLSITAGYHRLWSHKAYKAHPAMRFLFALGGALALQNSALHWSSDHRIHHKHVDNNDKDPYSAKLGFWYSHIGWMLREYQASRYSNYNNVRDLQNDRIVMWQHKHYLVLVILMNIGLPVFLGWLNGDILSMLLIAGLLRLVVVHHCTFFINSLAHIWGSQPYTDKNTARDNAFLALLTYGEGYHNFHHIFENDYRNGIKWWDYDPTKWLIKLLSWFGLAKDLRKVPQERIESARLQMQLLRVQNKVAHLPNYDEVVAKLEAEYELMKQHLIAYYQAKKALIEARAKPLAYQQLKSQVDELKANLLAQQQNWYALTASYR